MSDDITGDISDVNDGSIDQSAQQYDTGDDQMLGASIVPDISHPGTGWNVYDGGHLISTIIQSNITPGGFDIHALGSDRADSVDMGSVLDSFNFDPNDASHLWQHNAVDGTPEVVGTPDIDQPHGGHQTTNFTCAVVAQGGIIEEFTGHPISEAQLTYEATVNGWLSDHGTSLADVGKLMELHDIDCHHVTGATVEDLMAELSQGHKVIVGVDAEKLWNDSLLTEFFHHSADHAIWVTGVDITDSAHPKVIVNDSGDPTGAGKVYDLQTFANAWHDSGFSYVATDDAPPDMSLAVGHGFDTSNGDFPAMVSYFENLYTDFREHLQDRLEDHTPITPAETLTVFNDAAIRTFIDNLPKSPMASLSESTTDTLFRII